MVFPQCVAMNVLLAQILMELVAGRQQRMMGVHISCLEVYYNGSYDYSMVEITYWKH